MINHTVFLTFKVFDKNDPGRPMMVIKFSQMISEGGIAGKISDKGFAGTAEQIAFWLGWMVKKSDKAIKEPELKED